MPKYQRERLHRAKRLDNGDWVEGYYVCYRGSIHQIYSNNVKTRRGDVGAMFFDIDPETLCEYTGSSVKRMGIDAAKIYENHILKVSYNTHNEKGKVSYYTVEFVRGMFLAREIASGKIVGPVANFAATRNNSDMSDIKCEIIGNIIDDTKLLEKLKP